MEKVADLESFEASLEALVYNELQARKKVCSFLILR
jgi:hypothetical protein